MTYDDLINILCSENVYLLIKENEKEIFELIPELKICKGFNQNNKWHIYDVYEHILHVISGIQNNKILRLSALFHDIGKPISYTVDDEGVGHFYNHWNKSAEIFKKYINKFNLSDAEAKIVTNLIIYHDINIDSLNDIELEKMICDIGCENIKYLFSIKRADLLAQASNYHYLLENINILEDKVLRKAKSIKES